MRCRNWISLPTVRLKSWPAVISIHRTDPYDLLREPADQPGYLLQHLIGENWHRQHANAGGGMCLGPSLPSAGGGDPDGLQPKCGLYDRLPQVTRPGTV